MQVKAYDNKGKLKSGSYQLEDFVFNAPINTNLLTQVVKVYLARQRQSNANTKNRGEVRGGGKKPWRQKGTGRARHGSIRSPIWKGGGITFGPTNEINYSGRVNKKMLKLAMRCAFSYQAKAGGIVVFENFDLGKAAKTKDLSGILKNIDTKGKVLLIQNQPNQQLLRAARNLDNLEVTVINELNPYNLLNHSKVILLEDALKGVYQYWGKVKVETKKPKVEKPEKSQAAQEKVAVKKVESRKSVNKVKTKAVTKKTTLVKKSKNATKSDK